MFIWTGWGIIAAIIPFAMLVIAEALLGHERYASSPVYPTAAIFIGAAIVYGVARFLNQRAQQGDREMVDKATGQTVVLRKRHTLFFVDIKWWPYIIAVIGVICAITFKPE